jgi:hypothetical protein
MSTFTTDGGLHRPLDLSAPLTLGRKRWLARYIVPKISTAKTSTAICLALALAGCSSAPDPGPRTSLGVMTALPLFWAEGASPAVTLNGPDQRAPIIKLLANQHDLKPIDAISAAGLKDIKLLIIAQPRLLQPAELVALDQWVRDGGRVLIFADPALVWPSELAMGDRRRAPAITLLDPLYHHWALALDGPAPEAVIVSQGVVEGHVVALASPGQWRLGDPPRDCTIEAGGLVADCHIGRGEALLVADADLLDARLWAEKAVDGAPAVQALVARLARSGDTS